MPKFKIPGKGKSTNSLSRPHRDVVIGEPDVQGRFAGNQIRSVKVAASSGSKFWHLLSQRSGLIYFIAVMLL